MIELINIIIYEQCRLVSQRVAWGSSHSWTGIFSVFSIPVEVGKTILLMKGKLYTFVCSKRVSSRDGLACC